MLRTLIIVTLVFVTGACITPCTDGICRDGARASLVVDGECLFDAKVVGKDVFYTGHIMSFGACAAVQMQLSKKCYRRMAVIVAQGLRGMQVNNESVTCTTHIRNTPCGLGEHKWYADSVTRLGSCADIKLLYEDAMEECIREQEDARFWATTLYAILVTIALAVLGACYQCFAISGRAVIYG